MDPGNRSTCAGCSTPITFSARNRSRQAICNVYVDQVWNRVEFFHLACYLDAGQPYGAIT